MTDVLCARMIEKFQVTFDLNYDEVTAIVLAIYEANENMDSPIWLSGAIQRICREVL